MGLNPIADLPSNWYSRSLGPGYRRGWYAWANLGNRQDGCRLSSENSESLSRLHRNIIESLNNRPGLESFGDDLNDNYHGDGHVAISEDCSSLNGDGAMGYSATAARDPIFWAWHKHLDGIYQQHKSRYNSR